MGIWHRSGTVAVTNGSPTVTGTLTTFLVYGRPGDAITFDGGAKWYEIAAIDGNTTLTLATNFLETTATGVAYAINPSSYRHQIPSDILEQLRAVLAGQTNVYDVDGLPSNDFGVDGDLGVDFAGLDLYYKSAGSWIGPIPMAYGEGLRFLFGASTTMADPGVGFLRFNNATVASVTAIAIDDQAASPGNPDVSAAILAWDDSTTLNHRGLLTIRKRSNPSVFAIFRVSGASTDNAGWTQIAVAHVVSVGTFAASDVLAVSFERTGNAGDVSGPVSSVNDRIAVFSGTSGKVLVDGGQTIAGAIAAAVAAVRDSVSSAYDTLAEVATKIGLIDDAIATKATTGSSASFGEVTLTDLTPTTPTGDTVTMFARKAARMLPAFIGPSGLDTAIQPHMGRNKIGYWNPHGNAVTLPGVFGMVAPTAQGTVTLRNVAVTNIATRIRRLGYVSAATVGSLCGQFYPFAQYTVGNGSGLGGFFFEATFCMASATNVAGGRAFIGFTPSIVAATNVEPSTLVNSFGIAKLSTSQNLHLVYGGSSAQAPIDLGSDFPADSLSVDAYDVVFFCPPSSGDVHWQVRRLGTSFVAEGVITNSGTAVLPDATVLLAPRLWRCNNATAASVAIDISNVYIETDY